MQPGHIRAGVGLVLRLPRFWTDLWNSKKGDDMLEISTGKIVRVIALTREFGPDSVQLSNYISGLNDDEKANLVAVMWIGRGSFEAEELDEVITEAQREATAPTENYLSGIPGLAEHLENGLDALGIDVADAEDDL